MHQYRTASRAAKAITAAAAATLLAGLTSGVATAAPEMLPPPARLEGPGAVPTVFNPVTEDPVVTVVTGPGAGGKSLALTFDDGPDPVNTPALLAVMKKHEVQATFCVVGDAVERYPDLVRQIVAEGHALCNHSMHHDDFAANAWTAEQVRADLEETNTAIDQAAPGAPVPYFRAPYGAWGTSPAAAVSLGMQPLGWATDVNDWTVPAPTPAQVVQRVEAAAAGDVVLMHDGGGDRAHTVAGMDEVIPKLQGAGWSFVPPT